MAYKMDDMLQNFDVFPKIVVAGRPVEIRVRPLGGRRVLLPDTEYPLWICALDQGEPRDYPSLADFRQTSVHTDDNGRFALTHTFDSEQEYFLRVMKPEDPKRKLIQFSVYCVAEDLAGRWPLIGDLHIHTTCSDGNQDPEVVCANYRRYGYDFMVVSDHGRYYPSLRAIEFYQDIPTGLTIVPGEEVHMPWVDDDGLAAHIVNFGGEYSVNALVEGTQTNEVGKDLAFRAIRTENVPDVMTQAQFHEAMKTRAAAIDVPDGIDRYPAAVCTWVFDQIRNAGGLGIFPHPTWRSNVYHVPERFSDWIMKNRICDAFEVLGGERYYEQNGFQTARYYRMAAEGVRLPVVGSTDSHSSYESNDGAFICSTIVFSPENERKALIASIKDYYSVAVDTISREFRLVGEERFVRYGCFLLKHYFPLHDDLCIEEGRLMKQAVTGTKEEKAEAVALLGVIRGRVDRLREKYFAF